mmetsp:Transcript_22981/g.50085  ORF Transcript_22981/g.50085 Transcript_22981/m.50085 type:complete len:217 (-) Transcript_22981:328-978(-)
MAPNGYRVGNNPAPKIRNQQRMSVTAIPYKYDQSCLLCTVHSSKLSRSTSRSTRAANMRQLLRYKFISQLYELAKLIRRLVFEDYDSRSNSKPSIESLAIVLLLLLLSFLFAVIIISRRSCFVPKTFIRTSPSIFPPKKTFHFVISSYHTGCDAPPFVMKSINNVVFFILYFPEPDVFADLALDNVDVKIDVTIIAWCVSFSSHPKGPCGGGVENG